MKRKREREGERGKGGHEIITRKGDLVYYYTKVNTYRDTVYQKVKRSFKVVLNTPNWFGFLLCET